MSQPNRRQFCGLGLTTFAFGIGGPKNCRRRHKHKQLYHGPLMVSQEVIDIAYRSPKAVRTTARKNAIKVYHDDIAYIFRVVGGQCYIGEIVQTEVGKTRVHVWGLFEGPAKTVQSILDWKLRGIDSPRLDIPTDGNEGIPTDRDDITEDYLRG